MGCPLTIAAAQEAVEVLVRRMRWVILVCLVCVVGEARAQGPVVVAIKDMEGRTVGVVNAVNGTQYIGIGNTVAGMLLLQISDGKSSVIQKVIKL